MAQQKVHFILVSMGTKGIAFRHQAQPGKSKSLKDSYSTLIFYSKRRIQWENIFRGTDFHWSEEKTRCNVFIIKINIIQR